jgi:hypothetical protein
MRERLVSPAVIKIAAIVLAIKELWLLMGIPAFADTVISFLTVGAVPGTNRTLTPDEMYKLLIGVFVLFMVLVFHKEIIRIFRRHRQPDVVSEAAIVTGPPQMPLEHPLAMLGVGVIEEPVPKPMKAPRQPIAVHMPAFILPMTALVKAKLLIARQAIVAASVITWEKIKVASRHTVTTARLIGRTVLRVILLIIIVIADIAVVVWRMAEPYIRKFDAFLEKKTHEFEFTRTALSVGNDVVDTARKWGKNIKVAYDDASTPKSRDDE